MRKHIKILLTTSLTIFILLGFAVPVNMVGNWYQQFLPIPAGGTLKDIYFIDSLLGFAVTDSCIFKTNNSGDNWNINFQGYYLFQRIKFINNQTGFACGGNNKLFKTTNTGGNWNSITLPVDLYPLDMSVLNQDTIWLVDSEGLVGGAFRSINGGLNWQQRFYAMNNNPSKIYFYNSRLGFISTNSNTLLRRTSDGGASWNIITGENGFVQMCFADSLIGWRTRGDTMKYTNNSGLNWSRQTLPYGGLIASSVMTRFYVLNKDTVWGCGGGLHYPNNQYRGILYRTTNGGQNWLFQVPDTSINIAYYEFINFTNSKNGWAYANYPAYITGIHTTTGGNDTFYIGIKQMNLETPKEFKLYQNYPNPFNPITKINYSLTSNANVTLLIYDITGKGIRILVNENQKAGLYQYIFDGINLSSGVYFYQIEVWDRSLRSGLRFVDAKKMVLVK